jgi:hypothetical protein
MTNNKIWDCADMWPMISAKWNLDDSSVFYIFFFVFLVCKCISIRITKKKICVPIKKKF